MQIQQAKQVHSNYYQTMEKINSQADSAQAHTHFTIEVGGSLQGGSERKANG